VQEELQQMRIPVRLWATIKTMVAANIKAAAAAAHSLDARASDELAAHIAHNSSAGLQQGSTQVQQQLNPPNAEQQLHPDIMQRRMPRNFVGTGGARTTYLHVTGRRGAQEVYTLKVQALHFADGTLALVQLGTGSYLQLQKFIACTAGPAACYCTAVLTVTPCDVPAPTCVMLTELCMLWFCAGIIRMHCWVLLLQDEQLPAALQQELSQLEQFCCGSFYGQRVEPLRPVSFRSYQEELRWVAVLASASRQEVQQ
jgi:hypothetical protein